MDRAIALCRHTRGAKTIHRHCPQPAHHHCSIACPKPEFRVQKWQPSNAFKIGSWVEESTLRIARDNFSYHNQSPAYRRLSGRPSKHCYFEHIILLFIRIE
jgi:hypothetical protein